MPIGNLKLLVRPDPGGLSDHRRFLAEEARSWLASEGNLADFVISSEEGVKLPCHLSLLGRTRGTHSNVKLVVCFSSSLPTAPSHPSHHRVCLSLPALPASIDQNPEEHAGGALHWGDQRHQD